MVTDRAIIIDARNTRAAGIVMVAIAATWPLLPEGAGIPCPLRTLTGVPCPLCGMTTSVVSTVQGDLMMAAAANPFGILLVTAVLILLIRRRVREVRVALVVLLPMVLASWTYQLFRSGWLT